LSIYSPRGLKIRYDIPMSFSLIARLAPKYSAKDVLRLTEDIDTLPFAFGFFTGIVCFLLQVELFTLFIAVLIARVLGGQIIIRGLHLPFVFSVGKIFNLVFSWLVLPWVVPAIIGYFLLGWSGLVVYFCGQFAGFIAEYVFNYRNGKRILLESGFAFTATELSFILAYRTLAVKAGVTTSIECDDEELEENYWSSAFEAYSTDYPHIAERCS
jgi:hypothetical protein